MTPIEIAVTGGSATVSGAALVGLGYLRSLAKDARTAMRFLTGEEDDADDRGLVGRVREHGERLDAHDDRLDGVEQRAKRNTEELTQ